MPHRKEGCLLFEENISRQNSKMCLSIFQVGRRIPPPYLHTGMVPGPEG